MKILYSLIVFGLGMFEMQICTASNGWYQELQQALVQSGSAALVSAQQAASQYDENSSDLVTIKNVLGAAQQGGHASMRILMNALSKVPEHQVDSLKQQLKELRSKYFSSENVNNISEVLQNIEVHNQKVQELLTQLLLNVC